MGVEGVAAFDTLIALLSLSAFALPDDIAFANLLIAGAGWIEATAPHPC
jgi:hypothetical protein